MANYPKYTLTGKTPAATYESLVQYNVESSSLVNGDGNDLPGLNISGSISVNQPSSSGAAYAIDVFDSIGMSTFGFKNYIQFDDGSGSMFFNAGIGGYTYIAFVPSITASSFGHDIIPSTPNTIQIGNGQNVGINNSSPSYSLDVSGSINFNGDLSQNGNEYIITSSSYAITASALTPASGLTTILYLTASVTTMSFVNGLLQSVS